MGCYIFRKGIGFMHYLLLAIASSAMISLLMRLSSGKTPNNLGMLAMNYLMCWLLSAYYTGFGNLFPTASPHLPATLIMGAGSGVLYLLGFMLLQVNVSRNGVILPATFMKLGLWVPMVMSMVFFGEMPTATQILGFCIAIAAIVLIHFEKSGQKAQDRSGLLLLLLAGGGADAMSKVFEELGHTSLAPQFLFYTFGFAFMLCLLLAIHRKARIGKAGIIFGLLIGIPNFFSARFLLLALEDVAAVIAYPTYSVGTLLIVTLSGVVFFRERLKVRQWWALAAILAALVLLNL